MTTGYVRMNTRSQNKQKVCQKEQKRVRFSSWTGGQARTSKQSASATGDTGKWIKTHLPLELSQTRSHLVGAQVFTMLIDRKAINKNELQLRITPFLGRKLDFLKVVFPQNADLVSVYSSTTHLRSQEIKLYTERKGLNSYFLPNSKLVPLLVIIELEKNSTPICEKGFVELSKIGKKKCHSRYF